MPARRVPETVCPPYTSAVSCLVPVGGGEILLARTRAGYPRYGIRAVRAVLRSPVRCFLVEVYAAAHDHRRGCPRRLRYVWHIWEDRGSAKMVGLRPHETAFACIAPGLGDGSWLEGSLAQYSRSGPPKLVNKDACRYGRLTA